MNRIISLFLFCITFQVVGQQLVVKEIDDSEMSSLFERKLSDSIPVHAFLNATIDKLISKGYYEASIDSISSKFDTTFLHVHIGPSYLIKFKDSKGKSTKMETKKFRRNRQEVLQLYLNKGYPFASVKPKILASEDRLLQVEFEVTPNEKYVYDSLYIAGNARYKKRFLEHYLGVVSERDYSEKSISDISLKMRRLPYFQLVGEPKLKFSNGFAQVHMKVKKRAANQFDGLIGFLPNANNDNRLLVTGNVELQLENLFQSGKSLRFDWERFDNGSQELDASYRHPLLLYSPIGLNLNIELLRQDTTFINVDRGIAFFWENKSFEYGFGYKRFTSRVLLQENINTLRSFNTDNYHASLGWTNIFHDLFPRKGFDFTFTYTLAQRSLIEDETNSFQQRFEGNARKYFQLSRKFSLFLKEEFSILNANQQLQNDLFRLGGAQLLRGFDQKAFFASAYSVSSVELQYYFETKSSLFVFFDQGITRYNANYDQPFGTGIGTSLEVNNGVFSLIYALGKSDFQDFSFSLSKVHFSLNTSF